MVCYGIFWSGQFILIDFHGITSEDVHSEGQENSQTQKKKFEFFNENAQFGLFFSLLRALILGIVNVWK